MTDTPRFRLCLVGLPATGKTTYIAALWAYLTSGLPAGGYRVTEFPDDPLYLNQIAAAWSAGEKMPRNSLGASDRIEFTIESPNGAWLTLVLPDLPGEVFRNAILRPMIDENTAEAVTGSDLLLFFVNGETARTYAALGDYDVPHQEGDHAGGVDSFDAIDVSLTPDESGPREALLARQEFAIQDLDSDSLNTELLQRLAYLSRDRGLPPIVVVVSAWDAHENSGDTPKEWLKREQPMMAQLVEEFGRSVPVGTVGVSAQGGNYTDDPIVAQRLANERPWGCDEGGQRTDIAGPLLWYDGLTPDSDA